MTLQLFMRTLVEAGGCTHGFVVTLPKVTLVDQVEAFVFALGKGGGGMFAQLVYLEFEIQVEHRGRSWAPTDGAGTPAHDPRRRRPGHRPALWHLRLLRVAWRRGRIPKPGASRCLRRQGGHAGGDRRYRCVCLPDGSTNVLPVGDREAVRAAWRLHARLVRLSRAGPSTRAGTCTPAQLPSRYVAIFFREGLPRAAERLRAYVHGGQSGFLDEAWRCRRWPVSAPRPRVRRCSPTRPSLTRWLRPPGCWPPSRVAVRKPGPSPPQGRCGPRGLHRPFSRLLSDSPCDRSHLISEINIHNTETWRPRPQQVLP